MGTEKNRLQFLKKDSVQGFTEYIGLIPVSLAPGEFTTQIKLREHHIQQDGFVHAGVIATMADHTAGYAAYSLVPESHRILTIEYKINYLQPAKGELLECNARVLRPGKQILITEAEVYSVDGEVKTLVAKAMHTMASVPKDKVARREAKRLGHCETERSEGVAISPSVTRPTRGQLKMQ
jgi:uncharacterized protein (TIGR00369 family)